MEQAVPALQELQFTFAALLDRISAVEAAADILIRFKVLQQRITAVEQRVQQANGCPATEVGGCPTGSRQVCHNNRQACYDTALRNASCIQTRLAQELFEKGLSEFRFVRVPNDYYDQPLQVRQQCLKAASIHHLCKSIIMENTKAHPSVQGWDDPNNSKYYVVIVQYTARLNADKLKNHIHRLNQGKVGKQYFNMRLCPEDVSDQLSGYEHNAVTPIGMKTPLPVILSHQIAKLQPDVFFIGAGEVDLKVGLRAAEFINLYKPMVVDCTYDCSNAEAAAALSCDD
eukprot:gene9630-9790_t